MIAPTVVAPHAMFSLSLYLSLSSPLAWGSEQIKRNEGRAKMEDVESGRERKAIAKGHSQ